MSKSYLGWLDGTVHTVRESRAGFAYGVGAYGLWGLLPVYFGFIMQVGPFEIVPWRVLFTLVFCGIAISLVRRWGDVARVLRNRRLTLTLLLSALLLYGNWQIFVVGVMSGRVLETSLGYFMNPFVTVLIGVFVRKEKLSRLQWIAVCVAGVGVLAVTLGYGRFPTIAIGLALTFGLYGALHKELGSEVSGLTGLTVETVLTAPFAVVQAVVLQLTVGLGAFSVSPTVSVLVMLGGVMTAVPLILFGEAAARLKLSTLGFLQFITPVMSFLYGYFIAGEQMSQARWFGFIAVWLALTLLVTELVRQVRKAPPEQPPGLHTGPIPLD